MIGAITTLPLVAVWHGQGRYCLLLVRVFHGHQNLGLDRAPEIKRPGLEAEYSYHPRVRLRIIVAVLCCFSLFRCFLTKERSKVTVWYNRAGIYECDRECGNKVNSRVCSVSENEKRGLILSYVISKVAPYANSTILQTHIKSKITEKSLKMTQL
jgi:hypothetical protein